VPEVSIEITVVDRLTRLLQLKGVQVIPRAICTVRMDTETILHPPVRRIQAMILVAIHRVMGHHQIDDTLESDQMISEMERTYIRTKALLLMTRLRHTSIRILLGLLLLLRIPVAHTPAVDTIPQLLLPVHHHHHPLKLVHMVLRLLTTINHEGDQMQIDTIRYLMDPFRLRPGHPIPNQI